MPSISVLAILAAGVSLVSAAPQKRQQFSHTLGPAPFQGSLPTISGGVTPIDLDLSSYSAYGWPDDSDQFRCHGTCGILLRISRTTEKCKHPYAEPFSSYCVGQCAKADPGSVYPPAKVFAKECNFNLDQPTKVPKDEEKKPDAKEEKKDAIPTESSTQVPASTPSSSTAKDAPSSTASSVSAATPTKASVNSSASPISKVSPVSSAAPTGTGAPSAATPTAKTIVEVTNGASKSFGITTAVGVAALAMLAVC